MIYINILMITFIVMYIIDKSGFIIELSKIIYEKTHKKEWNGQLIGKPFSCSSCSSFWIITIYLLIVSNLSIITILMLSVVYSSIINLTLSRTYDIIIKIIFKIK